MKLNKLFIGTILTALVTFAAIAATPVEAPKQNTSLFNSGEIGLTLGSGYVLDTAAPFKQAYSVNASAGAFWFPFRNLGVEANVPFYSTTGVSVSEVAVGSVFRLPLSSTVPVLKNVAPYVGLGGVYNWDTDSRWVYVAKAGLEFRLNKGWGVFVEDQFRNDTLKDFDRGQNTLATGLKLVF